ncbi:Crp/Fnr family transcriptional regulator [Enhydrobacter sp.]|jgi:CRP-like cAMP-binding protein|uniref:Crp/Fnr family transcriptional regulator n=1 Tax=Enhydrobacter sp. TaxID=1894999 RepID=UPI00262C2573|nr:Crp/Fnr family transcriptional regulator [Enhydrobacter sp.]WIM09242.1 MAG: hypothetical protein OJF58_000193 [Enhydrobacter sp.]
MRELANGEPLFRQGDPVTAIYRVESGRLRLVRRTIDDHLVILHTAREGEFFSEAALFAEAYHCDAVATAPSRIRVYAKKAIKDALRTDPALSEAFMARLARQLQDLRARMELRNIRSARERVMQYLRSRAGAGGRRIAVESRLQDIAAEVGLTREALYRTLASLEAEGRIARTKSDIRITRDTSR